MMCKSCSGFAALRPVAYNASVPGCDTGSRCNMPLVTPLTDDVTWKLALNQLNEVVTGVELPKLVESTPAFADPLNAFAFTTEPIVTHLLSSLEFRRYCAVTVLVENTPRSRRSKLAKFAELIAANAGLTNV